MNILIFHIGSLGDTLVSVPALHVVREHFPNAHLTLLTDFQIGKHLVRARDILNGSGLMDDYLEYHVDVSRFGKIIRPIRMLRLLMTLWSRSFDCLIYLIRTKGREPRVTRDIRFFRFAGIREFIGIEGFVNYPPIIQSYPPAAVPQIGEQYLLRLSMAGLSVPGFGKGYTDLKIGEPEKAAVRSWLANLADDRGRRWLGVGIGGKQPVNLWPIERYEKIVHRLIDIFDLWPVVFGGSEDRKPGERLVSAWGRGYVAAGALSVRQSIAALRKCALFVGNDTGTIHMAAAAGVRCVGIYSSRNYPGEWHPYGTGHIVLRSAVDCEGCMLENCATNGRKCILSIDVEQVYKSCVMILQAVELQ